MASAELPLLAVRFAPDLDDNNAAPAGRRSTIPVSVDRAGTTDEVARVHALMVEVSYDERPARTSLVDNLDLAEDGPPAMDGAPPTHAVLAHGPQGVLDAGGHGLIGAFLLTGQAVGAVHLQDGRDGARERVGAGFERAEGGGVGVQTGVDRHLVVVVRIIAGGVGREAARRAMLEALVHRQMER